MTATHETIIDITVLLDPPPADAVGFKPALVGDFTLDGDRVRTYTTASEIDADETAGHLSAFAANALRRGISQQPRPGEVKAVSIDPTGAAPDAYDDALTAALDIDPDIYGIAIDSRTASDQIAVAAWAEARDKVFVFQSDDADILTTGFPSAYSTIEDSENTGALYHDDDTRSEDFSWLCNRLAFDPDERSAPWDAPLNASVGYTSPISTTEKGHAEDNNFNLLLPLGPSNTYVANEGVGVNLAGRQISEIVTKHWFKVRLREAVANEKVKYSGRGEKIPVSPTGVAVIESLVEDLFSQGERAGHFVENQTETDFPIPTSADIDANRIRGGGQAQLATSAGVFVFNFVFSRDAVVEEA